MTTSTPTSPTTPRRPALDRGVAMRLAATEYDRFLGQLARLAEPDWKRPTACPEWDVRSLATHVLGMADMAASVPGGMRQALRARRRGGVFIDALTGLQVEDRAGLGPDQIVSRFATVGPRAARGRARTPGFVRARTMPGGQPVGDGTEEAWTIGYLLDVILTRDTWMHRMDLAAATRQTPELTPEHDGTLVDDVAREWAARHAQPCTLVLTGPAGGTWTFGAGTSPLELDAIEFCRQLSGRGKRTGLLQTAVPF